MADVLLAPLRVPYLRRALIEVMVLAVVGGLVGVHVVLRRLAFLTDAVQHAVLPGIAVAFVTGTSLFVGALAAAIVAIATLLLLTRLDIDQDAALAVIIATFVAVGVLVVSRRRGFQSDLNALLFGRLLTVRGSVVGESLFVAALVVLVLAAVHKELVLVAFDRAAASALGYRVVVADGLVYALVAASVVACARVVGTVLAVAFVVTPAATARVLTTRIRSMMVVAAAVSGGCGWLGLGLSYMLSVRNGVRLAPGASIVVLMTLVFVIALATRTLGAAFADRRGRGPAVTA